MSGLDFGTQHRSSSVKMEDGVFIDKGRINKARFEYDAKMIEDSEFRDDVAVRLKLGIEGLDFEKDFYIGGNYKREGTPQGGGMITGWGSAFKVRRLLDELQIVGTVDPNGRIDPELAGMMAGREIFYLQYVCKIKNDGKPGYADYRIVAAAAPDETDDEVRARLHAEFRKDLSEGYLKNFHPEYLKASGDGAGTDFDFGANTAGGWTSSTSEAAPW